MDGQATSMAALSFASAAGAGSKAMTSMPRMRSRAAQPAPIRPVPATPTVAISRMGSPLPELQDVARLGRSGDGGADELKNLDGAIDQRAVRGIDALFEPEIVLQPDTDMAAEERCLGDHRHLAAADAEGCPDGVGR